MPILRRTAAAGSAGSALQDPALPRVPSLGNGLTTPITPADYPRILETLRATALPEPQPEFLIGWDGIRTDRKSVV